MAFDYGSIDLGLRNPFKFEGAVTALRGVVLIAIGLTMLFGAVEIVGRDAVPGWIMMIFGVGVLAAGVRGLSSGLYARFRYFVGRNHPTSLAYNFAKSESQGAKKEKAFVAYNQTQLKEMLVGRKNLTFTEPQGFVARFAYSFLPNLLFLPFPIRKLAHKLIIAWASSLIALMSLGFISFVSLNGFAGDIGRLAYPVYLLFFLLYLLGVWRQAAFPIMPGGSGTIDPINERTIVKVVVLSIVSPVLIGAAFTWIISNDYLTQEYVEEIIALTVFLRIESLIALLLLGAVLSTTVTSLLLYQRMSSVNPTTEVSELRENWQESVHPNEIFINLDNLVMANRRFKEVPNRVYLELDPKLKEQTAGKGDFSGELIQEVQPKVKSHHKGHAFLLTRGIALILSNALFVAGALVVVEIVHSLTDVYKALPSVMGDIEFFELASWIESLGRIAPLPLRVAALCILLSLVSSFANIFGNTAHLFFAEIQFESLLVYFRCEGTFTESKISTGTGVYDSTKSENTLVRSSITPWVIVTRIVTSTFAATGLRNLEYPRYILEMHKDENELSDIKSDIVSFLKDRESIASITSARDLNNASQIHQLNQQTRAQPQGPPSVAQEARAVERSSED